MIFSSESRDKRLQCYDGLKKLFWLTSKNDLITFDNIWNTVTVQGDDYTTGCLLDYPYFKEQYNMQQYKKLILLNI